MMAHPCNKTQRNKSKPPNLGHCMDWTSATTSHSCCGGVSAVAGGGPGDAATAQFTRALTLQRALAEIHNIWCLASSYGTIC